MYGIFVLEEGYDYGKAYRGLGSRNGNNKKHQHMTPQVLKVVAEGDQAAGRLDPAGLQPGPAEENRTDQFNGPIAAS